MGKQTISISKRAYWELKRLKNESPFIFQALMSILNERGELRSRRFINRRGKKVEL